MPEVVVTEVMDEEAVALMATELEVHYDPDLYTDRLRLSRFGESARALVVRNQTQVDRELIVRYPELEMVGRLGVGLDNIDIEECRKRGIEVVPAAGTNATAVAEYVIATSLLLTRRAFHSSPRVISGEWPRTELVGNEVSGRTMGLIGLGSIAQEVAKRARALEMTVIAHDPYLSDDSDAWGHATQGELSEVISSADILSIHVPLTDTTKHLIDRPALETMRSDSILINTSRGGIVDESALADLLTSGHLGGAALDVFEEEPVDAAAGGRFCDVPNLILTPHIAGITHESNRRTGLMIAQAVLERIERR